MKSHPCFAKWATSRNFHQPPKLPRLRTLRYCEATQRCTKEATRHVIRRTFKKFYKPRKWWSSWMPANTLYMHQPKKKGKLQKNMVCQRPAVEDKCFNYRQWSRGSKQSLWKRVLTSQRGGAHRWCRKDEQVEQQVHRGSAQTNCSSEEPLRGSSVLSLQKLLICTFLLPEACVHPPRDQLPKESYKTTDEEEKQQKLPEEQVRRCSSNEPWNYHKRNWRCPEQED